MRKTTSDISPTPCAKVSSRVYRTRALSLNTCSNFSGSNTRSSVPRTMTLTGLRSMNFSKHSPKIISLAPGAFHCCGAFPCKPLSQQSLCNHGRFPPLQGWPDYPKLLVLDDVLIGLDMANRMPVLDILRQYFADWQI